MIDRRLYCRRIGELGTYWHSSAKPLLHLLMTDKTRLLLYHAPLVQHHEIGNTLHAEASGKLRMRFRINFEHNGLALHLGRGFCDLRSSGSARTAPGSPEIHQHRYSCVLHYVVEQGNVGRQRLRNCWQISLARAASTGVGKVVRRDTILLTAL
jgi:hypothetical protein